MGLQFWTWWGYESRSELPRSLLVSLLYVSQLLPGVLLGRNIEKAIKEKKRKEKKRCLSGKYLPPSPLGLQAYFCSKYWKFNWKHLKIFQIKFKIFEILKIKFTFSLHIFLSLKYICFLQQLVDQPWLMIFETVGERCRIPIIGDYPRFRGNLSQGILPSSSSLEKTSSDSWWHHKMQ